MDRLEAVAEVIAEGANADAVLKPRAIIEAATLQRVIRRMVIRNWSTGRESSNVGIGEEESAFKKHGERGEGQSIYLKRAKNGKWTKMDTK